MTKTSDVEKVERRLRQAKSSERATWANECMDDRKFKKNVMWKQADEEINEERGQVSARTNELIPTIDLVVAELTKNNPRFTAIGREYSDAKTAAHVADLFAYIWDVSKGNVRIKRAVTDFEDIGMFALQVYFDPYDDNGRGEIKFYDVDPMELYIAPNAKEEDSSDADYIMVVKNLTEETVEKLYPGVNLADALMEEDDYPTGSSMEAPENQVMRASLDPDQKHYKAIDYYEKIKAKRYHVYDPNSDFEKIFETEREYIEWANEPAVIETRLNGERYLTSEADVEEAMGIIRNYGLVIHYAQDPLSGQPYPVPGAEYNHEGVIPNSTIGYEVVFKADLIERGVIVYNTPLVDRIKRIFSIGGIEIVNYVMPGLRDYPIVTAMLHSSRNPYPMGDIRVVRPLQELLNKIDNLIITYNQNITNVKWFTQKGDGLKKQLDKEGAKAGQAVFESNDLEGKPPIPIQLTQMSNSFYIQRENIIRQIQRIIGAYSFQDGDASQAPQTFRGTMAIDEMMQRRTASKMQNIEASLNQVAKVVSQMIKEYYTERKAIRIVIPNHNDREVVFNQKEGEDIINSLTSQEYDIKILSGSMLPTNKQQRREEIKEALQTGIMRDTSQYIRLLDLPNVDEVLETESIIKQQEQLIGQLQEAIKNLEGDMQTKDRELEHADRRIADEKYKSKQNKVINKLEGVVEVEKAKSVLRTKAKA